MVFFNFFNFFAISLEFSISRRVGTERNDNFYFLSFSRPFPTCFGLIGCHYFKMVFLFSLFHGILQPILAENEAIVVFFNFLNFFAIFLEFSISRRVGTEQNVTTIFIFSLSLRFPTYFVLKRSHNGLF